MMTLEQLRIFVAVAEREHLTQAADALHLTPSAVSSAVRVLEDRYGIALFHRTGRRIELTEAGLAFLPEAKAGRHRFQYIPFGAGPRTCVGARFAMAEALTVLAHWLARWRFAPEPGREVRLSGMVTLRPKGGLPLRLARA